MKIEDFKKVEFLIKLKGRLDDALEQCDNFLNKEPEVDAGGIEGFNTGYWGAVAKHSDGSGPVVNLIGCYVQEQVVAATRLIVVNQRQDVLDALTNLGVDL